MGMPIPADMLNVQNNNGNLQVWPLEVNSAGGTGNATNNLLYNSHRYLGFLMIGVLENLIWSCQTRETVIQTLLMKVHGEPTPPQEIAQYVERLREILHAGGKIKLVQLYTVARGTTEAYATPLCAGELVSKLLDREVERSPQEEADSGALA